MKKFTYLLKILLVACAFTLFIGAGKADKYEEAAAFIQQTVTKYYNKEAEPVPLKKYEVHVTNTGFCRFKKYYNSGKTEFFAFNISRFKELNYYGSEKQGSLHLSTINDDVIVQTYNDKKGDIDSTTRLIVIPLKEIDVEQLNALNDQFLILKSSFKK